MSCWRLFMKKVYDPELVAAAINASKHREMLRSVNAEIFLAEYNPREYVVMLPEPSPMFQIIISGELSIIQIQEDGSHYSVSHLGNDCFVGESFVLGIEDSGMCAQALTQLTCIAFYIDPVRAQLLSNCVFLREIAIASAYKARMIAVHNFSGTSLQDRLLEYIRRSSNDGRLKGVEKTAFHLHCSARHLQRVLDELVRDGTMAKTGKGAYILTSGQK